MDVIQQIFPIFLLMFCRITSFFVVAPIFAIRNVPSQFKIGLGFFISLLVYLAHGSSQTVPLDGTYLIYIIHEILAGLLLGFVVYLFFMVVQIAGAFIDLQMGFGMANIIDPMTGVSAPLTGNFKYFLLIAIFLVMNGHHYLLLALMDSYDWLPLSGELFAATSSGEIAEAVIRMVVVAFLLGFQLASPIMVSIFLTDAGLGFLAKTAPQFNVFVIGMPVKIIVGLVMLIMTMVGFASFCSYLMSVMFEHIGRLIAVFTG